MTALFIYASIIGSLLIGIRIGILLERRRIAHQHIDDEVGGSPYTSKIIKQLHDNLKEFHGHEHNEEPWLVEPQNQTHE